MTPRVSVIVATYQQPAALRAAVESVRRQSLEDWELLVIGDHCDSRTEAVMAERPDPRIHYHNLRERFGEQSGPNSVGLALARGEHVAFLNHDDLWLPDHLARGVAALESGDDFFITRFARARPAKPEEASPDGVFFEAFGPASTDPYDAYDKHPHLFEPCSAWVVRGDLARRVGGWKPARTLYRTPAEDWFLGTLRRGARFAFGDRIEVIRLKSRYPHERGGEVAARSPEAEAILEILDRAGAEGLRERIGNEAVPLAQIRPDRVLRREGTWHRRWATTRLARQLFRATGIDLVVASERLHFAKRGRHIGKASRRRTGDGLPRPPSVRSALQRIESEIDSAGSAS